MALFLTSRKWTSLPHSPIPGKDEAIKTNKGSAREKKYRERRILRERKRKKTVIDRPFGALHTVKNTSWRAARRSVRYAAVCFLLQLAEKKEQEREAIKFEQAIADFQTSQK